MANGRTRSKVFNLQKIKLNLRTLARRLGMVWLSRNINTPSCGVRCLFSFEWTPNTSNMLQYFTVVEYHPLAKRQDPTTTTRTRTVQRNRACARGLATQELVLREPMQETVPETTFGIRPRRLISLPFSRQSCIRRGDTCGRRGAFPW